MIWFELKYRVSTKVVKIYNSWDIAGEEVVYDWSTVSKDDKGKLIAFDDGSELYARIIGVSDTCIGTEIGKFRRDDIIHCCIPKWPNANYSGAIASEESIYVRPPSPREKGTVTRLLKGENIPSKYITPRINMLSLKRMREIAKDRGIGEEYLMDKLIAATQDVEGRNWKYGMDKVGMLLECPLFTPKGLIPENTNRNGALGDFVGEVTKDTKRQKRDNGAVTMNLKTLKSLIKDKDISSKVDAEVIQPISEVIPEAKIIPQDKAEDDDF